MFLGCVRLRNVTQPGVTFFKATSVTLATLVTLATFIIFLPARASAGYFPLRTANVGIGMSAPQVLLHVGSGGTLNNAGSGDVYIQNDLEVDGVLYGNASGVTGAGAWTDDGAVVRTSVSVDNVGIGTTAPEQLLEVQGAEAANAEFIMDADDGDDAADTWLIRAVASNNELRFLSSASTIELSVTSDGKLGIGGTTNSSAKVHAVASNWFMENNRSFSFLDNGGVVTDAMKVDSNNNVVVQTPASSGNLQYQLNNTAGGDLFQFFTDASYILRVQLENSGDFGIGPASGSVEQLLEVQGAEATNSNLVLDADDGDDAADTFTIRSVASSNDLAFLNDTTTLMTMKSNGRLGIGMSAPIDKVVSRGSGITTNINFQLLDSNGDKLLTVLDNGNVGIGNTNADYSLSILGSGSTALRFQNTTNSYVGQFRVESAGIYWEDLDYQTTDGTYKVTFHDGVANQIDNIDRDFLVYSGGANPILRYEQATGELGIGVAPDTDLDLDGTLSYTPSSTQSVTGVGGTISADASVVVVDPDGNYTLTSAPTISDGATGQLVYITSANAEANTVTVQDQDSLASSNLQLGAASRALSGKDMLVLIFDGTDWLEVSFINN